MQCKICLRPLEDPVSICCGHIFCLSCVRRRLGQDKRGIAHAQCPVCYKWFSAALPDVFTPISTLPSVHRIHLDKTVMAEAIFKENETLKKSHEDLQNSFDSLHKAFHDLQKFYCDLQTCHDHLRTSHKDLKNTLRGRFGSGAGTVYDDYPCRTVRVPIGEIDYDSWSCREQCTESSPVPSPELHAQPHPIPQPPLRRRSPSVSSSPERRSWRYSNDEYEPDSSFDADQKSDREDWESWPSTPGQSDSPGSIYGSCPSPWDDFYD